MESRPKRLMEDNRALKNGMLPRLEEWRVMEDFILGYVYNHPSFADGTLIKTSKIIFLADNMAITKNQPYMLGDTGRNIPCLDLAQSVH